MEEQKKSFNEFAIVSLVVGILSFVTLFGLEKAIIAIVFGILGLRRISRNTQLRGKALAITGIVLGSIAVVLLIVLGLYFLSRGPLQTPLGPLQTPLPTQSEQQAPVVQSQ